WAQASEQFVRNRITSGGDILGPDRVSAISPIYKDVSPWLDVGSTGQINHHRIHRYAANDRRRLPVDQDAAAIGQRKRDPVVVAHRNDTDPEIVPRNNESAAIANSVALLE